MTEDTVSALQLLLLRVEGQRWALHLRSVERVVRMVEITPLPGAPAAVVGVVNVQGKVLACVSIRRRLGLPERPVGPSDALVLARARCRRLAIITESVVRLVEVPASAFARCDEIVLGAPFVEGVLKTADGTVLIQDLDRFFSIEEERAIEQAMQDPNP